MNETLLHLLLALGAIVLVGRLLGQAMVRVGQPPVIGEVFAGIALGPSLLGRVWPDAQAFLLPPSVAPHLGMVAQLGVVLYMFLVGLELNLGQMRSQARSVLAISQVGIVVPFALGIGLAFLLPDRLRPDGVNFWHFALFVGIASSITAFPVLARILTDRGLTRTALGRTALSSAAVGDVTAWCLLAVVVGVAHSALDGVAQVFALTILFTAGMFLVVGPLLKRFLARYPEDAEAMSPLLGAVVLAGVLFSAAATEAIGIHALFGAFLLGAVIPHESIVARHAPHRYEDAVTVLLLPAFFAYTGMRTEIGLVATPEDWLWCAAIIAVATLGKVGGTLIAARWVGFDWRTATALGVLMNTRGLMELIVLNIGLELGIISPTLYAMMVLMAIATTVMTTPLVDRITRRSAPATGTTVLTHGR